MVLFRRVRIAASDRTGSIHPDLHRVGRAPCLYLKELAASLCRNAYGFDMALNVRGNVMSCVSE